MKTKGLIVLFSIGLIIFNFSFKFNDGKENNLTLKNISLMQATAFEYGCDSRDQTECSATYKVGTTTYTVLGTGWFYVQ